MALAHHIMWTVYGRWLPNDVRGSLSKRVRSDKLYEALGRIKMYGRARKQPERGSLREQDAIATSVLRHPVRLLTGAQARVAAGVIADALGEWGIRCSAFAILPDHLHAVIAKPARDVHGVILGLQRVSRRALRDRWPEVWSPQHPVWTRGGGHSVFLESRSEVADAIEYVRLNPVRAGLRAQRWRFVERSSGVASHDRARGARGSPRATSPRG